MSECTICLEKNNQQSYKLDCSHEFHKECFQKWMINDTCPNCRKIYELKITFEEYLESLLYLLDEVAELPDEEMIKKMMVIVDKLIKYGNKNKKDFYRAILEKVVLLKQDELYTCSDILKWIITIGYWKKPQLIPDEWYFETCNQLLNLI